MKTKLKKFYHLGMTKELLRLQDKVYADVLAFAKFKTGKSDLEDLPSDLDSLCDAYFLIQAGALTTIFADCLPGCEGEGVVLRLNL